MTHRPRTSAAFTIVELLVAIVVVLILLSIFVPYLLSIREQSRRTTCSNNLRQIVDAMWAYANANNQDLPRVVYDPASRPNGYVAFTGANDNDPFVLNPAAPGSDVKPSDVSASLFLLIRDGYVGPKAFVCPSSSDVVDRVDDPSKRSNFTSSRNLSYSYAMPFSPLANYKFNHDRLKAAFVVLADKNPGIQGDSDPTAVNRNAPPLDWAHGNSRNHGGAGQNVVYVTGIEFQITPYCGFENDNIYTAQAPVPTTQPSFAPDVNGVLDNKIGPARPDDSYLVPTEADAAP
jgi:type II secretory pathway pseudopilin PulG